MYTYILIYSHSVRNITVYRGDAPTNLRDDQRQTRQDAQVRECTPSRQVAVLECSESFQMRKVLLMIRETEFTVDFVEMAT